MYSAASIVSAVPGISIVSRAVSAAQVTCASWAGQGTL